MYEELIHKSGIPMWRRVEEIEKSVHLVYTSLYDIFMYQELIQKSGIAIRRSRSQKTTAMFFRWAIHEIIEIPNFRFATKGISLLSYRYCSPQAQCHKHSQPQLLSDSLVPYIMSTLQHEVFNRSYRTLQHVHSQFHGCLFSVFVCRVGLFFFASLCGL